MNAAEHRQRQRRK